MSKVIRAMKKVYWKGRKKIKKLPPVKAAKKYMGRKRKDKLLYETLPAAYNAHKNEPVDERKVIFIELRLPDVSNSFRILYDELQRDFDLDIHVHLLRNSFVPREEYIRRCKEMLADAATAKYIFVNEASDVLSCVDMRPETIVTQLWHACGAFKKFGMSTAELIFGPNAEELKRHPNNKNYTYVTVSSPEIVWAYAEAMDMKDRQDAIRPVGTSRTDIFYRSETIAQAFQNLYKEFPKAKGKKIILYAPTFRGRVARAKTPDCFDLEKFAEHFKDEYVVIFKHHPLVKKVPQIPEELNGTFAIDATKTMTIEDLLCVSDICISDYSSLVFEYSLFERPMLFFAYDLDEYFDWRGFYYDYNELTPGPVCKTNDEMIDYISHLDERFDKQKVIDFKEKFMRSCDGHATDRILHMVFADRYDSLKLSHERTDDEIKVSVVMPVYNAENYLFDSLGNVLKQTLKDIEVICVDDGSTDRSAEIIEDYASRDFRLSLIRQKNQYAGAARNAGLAKCRGKYVVFWDADDRFALDALEKLYTKAEADEADLCVCDIRKWDHTTDRYVLPSNYLRKEYMPETVPFSKEDIPQYIFNFTTNIPWNKMYRRSLITDNDLKFEHRQRANDVVFVMQALYLAKRITVVDERLIDYRYNNANNLTAGLSKDLYSTYDAFLAAHDILKERGAFENEKVKQSFDNKTLNLLVQSIDLQTNEASARELFDMLLQEGFRKIGIEDYENYYYSRKVYQAYRTMLTGSLVDTLIVLKEQKNTNLEVHRQKLCMQRLKVQRQTVKIQTQQEKLDIKTKQLKKLRGQIGYRICRKLGFFKE